MNNPTNPRILCKLLDLEKNRNKLIMERFKKFEKIVVKLFLDIKKINR